MLVKILDASGVSAFSTVQIAFDPLGEQVYVNDVRVMDADGKIITTGNHSDYYVLDDRSASSASQKKILNIPVVVISFVNPMKNNKNNVDAVACKMV